MTQTKLTALQQLYKPAKRSTTRILAACDIIHCDMVDTILGGRSTTTGVLPNLLGWEIDVVKERMFDDGVNLAATYDSKRKCWEYKATW